MPAYPVVLEKRPLNGCSSSCCMAHQVVYEYNNYGDYICLRPGDIWNCQILLDFWISSWARWAGFFLDIWLVAALTWGCVCNCQLSWCPAVIIRSHCSATYIVTNRVAWSLSVCLFVTLVSPAKTAELIEMPFGLRTQLGAGNHVFDGGPDPHMERGNFDREGAFHCKV